MSIASARDGISAPHGIVLLFVLFAVILSLAYALISGNILLWITAVVTAVQVVAVVVFLYLFYRLVLAVERIAADS